MSDINDKYFYGTGSNYRDYLSKWLERPETEDGIFKNYLMQEPFSAASATVPESFDTAISIERELTPDPSIELKTNNAIKYKMPSVRKAEIQFELNKLQLDIESLKAEIREQQKKNEEKQEQPFHFNPEDLDI